MKRYTLFAGVNGAGKTTLYHAAFENSHIVGSRINIDELVCQIGSWKDPHLQMEVGKKAILTIRKYLDDGKSFHQETTLAGRSIFRTVKQAKSNGYQIVLYYVGVDTPLIAQQRVAHRVKMGGHGIEDSVIEKRFYKSLLNLSDMLKLCDIAHIYDNSGGDFRYVMVMKNQNIQWQSSDLPQWLIGQEHIML